MDGVFMKKLIKLILVGLLITTIIGGFDLWKDRQLLKEKLIRLHIIGNSNSQEDQDIKLQLKDAIVSYLQPVVEKLPSKEDAINYLNDNVENIEKFANQVLDRLGVSDRAVVTIAPEAFDAREYNTFSLPSGIYDALKIRIGDAEGDNWWCVVFPNLCVSASSTEFQDVAVSFGFSNSLTNTIIHRNGYQLRFFLLDCLGKLENILV